MTRVLAVDGNSLAHRAWHAITGSDDAVGHFVTGGFVGMLGSAWAYGPFDGVVLAFDHGVNQRKASFPEYKANRVQDTELREHLDRLVEHMRACSFTVVVESGAEGDDVLAAVADDCIHRGYECRILSSDRDLTALVTESIHLLRPVGTMSQIRVYDPAAVLAEYGVTPAQYADLAALRGDPSDGLDGVTGIGAKTAARLLRDHGDLVGLYANLCNLPPKHEAALRQGREIVERNRLLMSPLPLSVDVSAAVDSGLDLQGLDRALTELGLGYAAGRFRFAVERPVPPPMPPPPDDEPPAATVPEAVRARRAEDAPIVEAAQSALF